jgi:PAS domain S-box-containing protein
MFNFLKKLRSNEIDFKPYRQKKNDFKRLAFINLIVCLIIAPLFCFIIKGTEISIIYFYLGLSYTLLFPLYMLFCWYVPYFRDKLFFFFIFHIFGMTFFAFVDLVENNFSIIDLFSFYCLFAISIFVIQRFYFGMVYIVFVSSMFLYAFRFVDDNQDISKELIFGFIFALSISALLSLYARNSMLLSIFDFNRYLKKLSQGDKFGFFLFKIQNDKIKILDFDEDIGNILTGKTDNTKHEFSVIFNEKLTKNDIKNITSLDIDQYITKTVKINDKSFELIISPIQLKKKQYFLVKTNNVTERVKEQEELIFSEEKYRNLYNENQAGVFTLNLSFHLVNYNKTFEQMFEGTFKIGSLFVYDDDEMKDLLDIISKKEKFNNYQTHFSLKNGTIKWLVFNFYFDVKNNLIEGSVVDVSDIQKATNELRKSEEKYKLIYEESNDAILLLDGDKVSDVNRRGMQLFGIPKEDFLNIDLWDLTHEKSDEINLQIKQLKHKLNSLGTIKFNWVFKGRFNPIEAEVSIIELIIGRQVIHQFVIHDVTEKNNTIRALEKSTENFRSALESTPEGIIILKDNDILYANKQVFQLIDNSEIDLTNLFIKKDQLRFQELLEQKKIDKKNIESQLNLKVKKGSILVDLTMVNTIFGATDAVLIIFKDISFQTQLSKEVLRAELAEENTKKLEKEIKERIKTERELNNLLLKTKAIYDSSSSIFLLTMNLEWRITYFNIHSKNYFEQIVGKEIKFGDSIYDYFRPIYEKENGNNEFNNFLKGVIEGKSIQFEYSFNVSGKTRWLEVFMNPIYDTEGVISEVSMMSHDITLKKETEKETIESLHEKEVLLKEIHHRVKNNLQVISSILNLQSSFVSDEGTLGILQESRNRIRSMAIIHENLYRTTNFSSIDFAGYLKNLAMNLSALYHQDDYNVTIVYDLQEVNISLDQAVPSGLIMNELITNSLKYAFVNRENKKNKILISMKESEGIISMEVKDNGIGLPDNFEIGKTDTLGLQLVVTLSEQLDASLTYKSENGTDFLVSFEKM